jgi:hypothetical protein
MREDEDDHIRLHSPVLHRIIILLAVIAAVPVVLWSISAFVRAYVAPPKLPTFHPMAAASSTAPQISANAATDAASLPAPDKASKSDARSHVADLKNPPGAPAAQDADPTGPSGGPYVPVPAATTAPPSVAATAYATPDDATNAVALPGQAPSPAPGNVASLDTPQQPASTGADSDALPAEQPLAGPIPLPPHRPRVFAMLQTGVPMPRPRPADSQPAAAPDTGAGPLDWLGKIFHQGDQ